MTSESSEVSKELGRSLYHWMLRTQILEDSLVRIYKQGAISGGLFTGPGNEAVSVGAAMALQSGDVIAPTHRGNGAHLVRGETVLSMVRQLLARATGPTHGKDNSMHQGSAERGIIGFISHLGATAATAAGAALAFKVTKKPFVALGFVGDGTTSLGDFHETMNAAAVLNVPFVMIIENNQFAYSTPNDKQYRCENLSDRARGYGIPGITIDGTDVELVYRTTRTAVERAREGHGPTLIEAKTMRLGGHSAADGAEYVPPGLIERWREKHPVTTYRNVLIERGWLTDADDRDLRQRLQVEIDEAIETAKSEPYPEARVTLEGVYAR
ncbi:MAG: thiamine pyrophosphate-dependent dehydrogenase E1 component subunit alpha [Bdellovibrionales bacterium]|nr:thiamine pyrophosphate-dependent dehydrogenase E1 component subunit alpha [Bdellovibrionales bacterium]